MLIRLSISKILVIKRSDCTYFSDKGGLISDEFGENRLMIFFNTILLLVYAMAIAIITITHNILSENLNL